MEQLNLPLQLSNKQTKPRVKTSKRVHTWTVQKKEGGRWRSIVDSIGVITFTTRKLARSVSREYNNTSSNKRSYRVKKLV